MGKKIKKKTRNPDKEGRVSSTSHETTPTCSNPQAEIGDNGVLEEKERKLCTHVDKSVDLNKISLKIRSLESVKCQDCREGALDRRESKGRSKHGKKKGTGQGGSRSESKSVWICLECGHLACGGVGLPTAPQSHSLRHARQTRHHCVIQFNNPHLRWCFPCNLLIPVGKAEEGEQTDVFSDIVKLIKGQSFEGASLDVEDVWFGNGNAGDITKIKNAELQVSDRKGVHVVRGLVNLGNTCFFNSVLQNILAVEQLRDYFIELDHSVGPLTMALKKLFNETSVEDGLRSEINPRTLFGCICKNAPQFRGYQQQDSHELLRYLLDGLHTEESGARKLLNSSGEDKDSSASNRSPTFVDTIFGGQLSSTVCCVECGHSSVVYEPFLDLSLPVPTKKSPSKKKAQSVSRSKKAKLPLKKEVNKGGKSRLKGKTDITPVLSQCATSSAEGENSLCQPPSSVVIKEDTVGSLDDFSWLDYIGGDEASNDIVSDSQNCNISIISGCENKEDISLNSLESQIQSCSPKEESKPGSGGSWENSFVEEELPLQVKDSEVLLLPYKEESLTAEVMCIDDGASSSVVGCGQDTVDFDGFGDLFNEPEVASSTNTETWLYDKNIPDDDVMGVVSSAGKSSDSDSDEVDDTDAPVSINSCLVYFTKPELLSNEHAWHCENCSNILRDQQMEISKTNGSQSRSRTASLDLGGVSTECRNLVNGTHNGSRIDADSLVAHINKPDSLIPCYTKGEINSLGDEKNSEFSEIMSNCQPDVPHGENDVVQSIYILQEVSLTMGPSVSSIEVSFGDQVSDACGGKEPDTIGINVDQLQRSTRIHESNKTKEVKTNFVKAMRDATKRLLINSAPQILTIHLKRFSKDARGRLSKLSGYIGFCDTLDLRPYMDPRSNNKSSCNYCLVGVVEHSGTMRGGHYVAYVRDGKCQGKTEKEGGGSSMWFYASDSYVRVVSLAEVLRCEAYILFYERV